MNKRTAEAIAKTHIIAGKYSLVIGRSHRRVLENKIPRGIDVIIRRVI